MLFIEIFLYVSLFIMGSVFGSFFTLAVYRLPRKENITYVRSHCTSCDHKLNFLDLIPIWSYIFLGGKCRYCKEKIRSRYILLEIFSGLVFLLTALSLKITAFSTLPEFINLAFIYLFMCAVFIIGGIDKEKYEIHEGTLLYGIIVALAYGMFNAIRGFSMKYALIGFLAYPLIMLVINAVLKLVKKEDELPIGFGDIEYLALVGLFLGIGNQTLALILAVILSVLATLFLKLRKKEIKIPFGFYLSIATAVVIILMPYIGSVAELINVAII
jgi:leader peptidase (prepilin peptidase)/N-methyltransferase